MNRDELEHLLEQVDAEKTGVQNQLAALQGRLTALTKAADGLQALLEMTPAPKEWAFKADSDAGQATDAGENVVRAPQSHMDEPPSGPRGREAARLILQSDQSKFWTVRQVSDEQVRRGWTKPRPRGAKKNAPARVALTRLKERYPENVEVIETPVLAYRWTSDPSRASVTSGNDFTPAENPAGVSTAGENGHSSQGDVLTRADLFSPPAR